MGTKTKALSVNRAALVRLGERAVSKHSSRVATQRLTEITLHCSECSERTHTPHRQQAVFASTRHGRQKPAPHEALRFAKKQFATCPVSNSLPNVSNSYTSVAAMSGSHPVEREHVIIACNRLFLSCVPLRMTNFCSAPAGILLLEAATKVA